MHAAKIVVRESTMLTGRPRKFHTTWQINHSMGVFFSLELDHNTHAQSDVSDGDVRLASIRSN
jgi:hypothetical protein